MLKSRPASWSWGLVLSCICLGISALPKLTSADEPLNRSFYVPVQINLCDHLSQAALYRAEQALRPLPGKQVFQFTFFPSLHRLVPQAEHVNIKAVRDDGKAIDMGLVVTSNAVYIGDKCVPLDLRKQLSRLRSKVDVRYDVVKVRVTCGTHCSDVKKQHKEADDR